MNEGRNHDEDVERELYLRYRSDLDRQSEQMETLIHVMRDNNEQLKTISQHMSTLISQLSSCNSNCATMNHSLVNIDEKLRKILNRPIQYT